MIQTTNSPVARAIRSAARLSRNTLGCLLTLGATAFAQTPAQEAGQALSPFGIGACHHTSQHLTEWIPQMSKIGLQHLRACRTSFGDVEPEEGKWTWERLDEQLRYADSNHMEFFGLLLGSPRWLKKDVPGGNMFVVDPNFLCYTATPIEIKVVVRRNPANDNAGFKLEYESTNGFKTAGTWYTVPDNKEWHTMSWKISDAQFVNYWGYNFSLNSDGNQYNKYFIQSVTVTKLNQKDG